MRVGKQAYRQMALSLSSLQIFPIPNKLPITSTEWCNLGHDFMLDNLSDLIHSQPLNSTTSESMDF